MSIPVTTAGLALDGEGNVWQYKGAFGWEKIAAAIGGGGGGMPTLGERITIPNDEPVPEGWYIALNDCRIWFSAGNAPFGPNEGHDFTAGSLFYTASNNGVMSADAILIPVTW